MEVKILKVVKKGKKYLVYSSENEDPITFTEDSLVSNRVFKDKIFEIDEWNLIIKKKEQSFIFDKVLHYIDFKPRTTKEVVKYLKEKDIDEESIDEIILRLKDIKYLDDEKYMISYIDESIRNCKGPNLIIHQLEQLGIDKSIIKSSLLNYTSEQQYDNAYLVASKYQRQNLKYPTNKQKELIYQKLIRSGYYHETINRVLNNLEYCDDSLENLEKEYCKLLNKNADRQKIIGSLLSKGYRYEDIKKVINK